MSSSRGAGAGAGAAALPRYARQSNEDYAAYVSRIEKTTSMAEGPHFPNIHAIYKHKEEFEFDQQVFRSRRGRFGTAVHLERLDDNSAATS